MGRVCRRSLGLWAELVGGFWVELVGGFVGGVVGGI